MCTSWLLTLLLVVTSISCLCLTTILQRCVCTVTRYQTPLASRRSLFGTVLTFDVFFYLRAIAVRQSRLHHVIGLELWGDCSRGSLQIC